MDRALREFRIRGVATNLPFLEAILSHPRFLANDYTTRFIDETPELFQFERAARPGDQAADLHRRRHRQRPSRGDAAAPRPPRRCARTRSRRRSRRRSSRPDGRHAGTKQLLDALGPEALRRTGCASRSACWSPTRRCATRTSRCSRRACAPTTSPRIAEAYAHGAAAAVLARMLGRRDLRRRHALPQRGPVGAAGAARANACRTCCCRCCCAAPTASATPTIPTTSSATSSAQAAQAGIDLFRVFDCLNWVENMRVAIDAVREAGKLGEGAICYTGDILDPDRAKYDLDYYVDLAKELEAAGCHILAIKDMAGLLQADAARGCWSRRSKQEVGLPIHFHTHDTSGIAGGDRAGGGRGRRRRRRRRDGRHVRP